MSSKDVNLYEVPSFELTNDGWLRTGSACRSFSSPMQFCFNVISQLAWCVTKRFESFINKGRKPHLFSHVVMIITALILSKNRRSLARIHCAKTLEEFLNFGNPAMRRFRMKNREGASALDTEASNAILKRFKRAAYTQMTRRSPRSEISTYLVESKKDSSKWASMLIGKMLDVRLVGQITSSKVKSVSLGERFSYSPSHTSSIYLFH